MMLCKAITAYRLQRRVCVRAWHSYGARAVITIRKLMQSLEKAGNGPVKTQPRLTASYEIDLWGGIRAGAAQSRFSADASEAAYRTLANTVAGEVSTYWLGLRVQAGKLRLLEDQKQRLATALKVVEGRKRRGQAALTDVWQQQQLVESLSVDIIEAEAQRDIYLQQLALWLGRGQAPITAEMVSDLTPVPQPDMALNSVPLEAEVAGMPVLSTGQRGRKGGRSRKKLHNNLSPMIEPQQSD